MRIYPKIDDKLNGIAILKKYIEENKGVELQFFHNNGIWGNYDIKNIVEEIMNLIPNIEEITIHPPLDNYDIELVVFKDIELIKAKIKDAIQLSNKYNIRINLLYHVTWPIEMMEQGVIDKIKELLELIQNTRVYLVVENIYSMTEFNKKCTVLEICRRIDNEHLKACLDICHLHCMANIFKINFDTFLEKYLDKELAKKYIYQIHFSATKDNDGFKQEKTHGRKHDTLEDLMEDYKILEKYELTQKNIITEVSEGNYNLREDQKYEIELLEKI